jgi:hypothetical protein
VLADVDGGLSQIGILHDQGYLYASGAAGYWVYQNDCGGRLTAVALQGELHYDSSLGDRDNVRFGSITVGDLASQDTLNGSAGAIFQFGERTNFSLGVSFPLAGDRQYDWNVIAQVYYQFGCRR